VLSPHFESPCKTAVTPFLSNNFANTNIQT
jgi:hypothetical protein